MLLLLQHSGKSSVNCACVLDLNRVGGVRRVTCSSRTLGREGVMGTNCITLHINSALRHALSPNAQQLAELSARLSAEYSLSSFECVFFSLAYLCSKKFRLLLLRNGT